MHCETVVAQALDRVWMSVSVADISFEGPFSNPTEIEPRSGLFVILQEREHQYEVVDFGFVQNLRADLSDDARSENFKLQGTLSVAVHYLDAGKKSLSNALLQSIKDWLAQ